MIGCFHCEVVVRILAQKHFAGEGVTKEIGDVDDGLLAKLFALLSFNDSEQLLLPAMQQIEKQAHSLRV